MKKNGSEFREVFHRLCLVTEDLFDKGIISGSTITSIAEGTQSIDLDTITKFYQSLLKILETSKTEEEILEKGLALRDSILK